jgi:hypothetical protein
VGIGASPRRHLAIENHDGQPSVGFLALENPRNRPFLPENSHDYREKADREKKPEKRRFRVDAFGQKVYFPARHSAASLQFVNNLNQDIRRQKRSTAIAGAEIFSLGSRTNRPRKRQESYAPLGPVASGLFYCGLPA